MNNVGDPCWDTMYTACNCSRHERTVSRLSTTVFYHNVCSFSLSISTVASTSCMPTGYVRNEFLYFMKKNRNNIYLLFIYYMVYTHVKSFTTVKNRKCGQVTSHCRKARPYRAHLSLFLNVPVATIKSEITVWGSLFQTVGEAWQKYHNSVAISLGLNLTWARSW